MKNYFKKDDCLKLKIKIIMGSTLIKTPRKNCLNVSVYYKNDVVSTIQISKEIDLKSFLLLNQHRNEKKPLKEIENTYSSIYYLPESIYISIDNISEFDAIGSIENYDKMINKDEDYHIDLSQRKRLNSSENYVTIVQHLDESFDSSINAKKNILGATNEVILNKRLLFNVMGVKNECSNI